MEKEFLQPRLLGDDGEEIPHLFDLITGLLDWDQTQRLGDDTIREQPYWMGADWEVVDRRRMPSPLLPLLRKEAGGLPPAKPSVKSKSTEPKGVRTMPDPDGDHSKLDVRTSPHRPVVFARLTLGMHSPAPQWPVWVGSDAAVSLVRAQEQQALVDRHAHGSDRFAERELDMFVDGWEFVSEHALAQEYATGSANLYSTI